MHPAVKAYCKAAKQTLPPDPCDGDVCLHRVPGESVYSVLPMTNPGRAFVLAHVDAGSVHGDLLLVPTYNIVPLFDALCDEGLRVV